MAHLHYRNVNDGFIGLVEAIHTGEWPDGDPVPVVRRPSRNGPVLMVNEPVTVTYERPCERVLFNDARDANPFSLLYEALWTLAGRNDVGPLAYYTKRMADYSDDGETWNDAYGYRWRKAGGYSMDTRVRSDAYIDQLDELVNHLKAEPTSRRAVLQMWNVEDDLLKIGPGDGTSKAVCCNLSVMFALREVEENPVVLYDQNNPSYRGQMADLKHYLDMTVTNRSNDLVWGMLGANYTTFTLLQEYVAARLGVAVGRYHHFSNNVHAYKWNWKPDEWLAYYGGLDEVEYVPGCNVVPLVKDPRAFESELPRFVAYNDGGRHGDQPEWEEPFFAGVAKPLLDGFHFHKERKDYDAALWAVDQCEADDWRAAARAWLERRRDRRVASARAGTNEG